jgi:ABC-2 type transport system ATP-binding protein
MEVAAMQVEGLTKRYPRFELRDVSFCVMPGSITGFVGRNGAGKTVTIKCLMGATRPDAGTVTFFGTPLAGNEAQVKRWASFALGGVTYYENRRLASIARATRRFYESWDDAAYRSYLETFALDESKLVRELSQGMRVKFELALALARRPRLLVLDEPTSGLDPASREEVLDILLDAVGDGAAVLFSTHIVSDLEKCADSIVHIRAGEVVGAGPVDAYRARFAVAPLEEVQAAGFAEAVLGTRRTQRGSTALLPSELGCGVPATLEDIMTHVDREA